MEERKPDWVYQAEAEKLVAEAELARRQAEKEAAEARKMLALAESAEIELDQKRKAVKEIEADNAYHRIYRFNSSISEASVFQCMKVLDVWRRVYPGKDIKIIFTSPGGTIVDGMALWDYLADLKRELHEKGAQLITEAHGMAASMAGILLQAGDVRRLGRESYVLIHQVQAGVLGSWGEIQDRMKWLEKIQERVLDIYALRSSQATGESFAKMRRLFKKEWERTDWWLDSEECLRLGIVDEIV